MSTIPKTLSKQQRIGKPLTNKRKLKMVQELQNSKWRDASKKLSSAYQEYTRELHAADNPTAKMEVEYKYEPIIDRAKHEAQFYRMKVADIDRNMLRGEFAGLYIWDDSFSEGFV